MNDFMSLPDSSRQQIFEETSARLGLPPTSVEKDYWVVLVLHALFSSPDFSSRLTFKGGTSLSKAWKLIERFSEDIDIVVERASLGFSAGRDPEFAASISARKRLTTELKAACARCTEFEIKPMLIHALDYSVGHGRYSVIVDNSDVDGQTLLVSYTSVFGGIPARYIQPSIKIELGARSGNEPVIEAGIRSFIEEAFPNAPWASTTNVRALDSRRTFLEKAFLLHEENHRPFGKPTKSRMSRHMYDLSCMFQAGIADAAMIDSGLIERIKHNRETMFAYSWMDYTSMKLESLNLVPSSDREEFWRRDYEDLRREMIYGKAPEYSRLIADLHTLEQRAREARLSNNQESQKS